MLSTFLTLVLFSIISICVGSLSLCLSLLVAYLGWDYKGLVQQASTDDTIEVLYPGSGDSDSILSFFFFFLSLAHKSVCVSFFL